MCVCVCVCVYVCMYVCMYVYTYMCIYILHAGGVVESALGLIQCAPIYIEVPEGDVHLTR
jgi:hypothetical protein